VEDEHYMRLAIIEARKGIGRTSPNPAVGAVIVSKTGRVLARGHHRAAGLPHAEIEALSALKRVESACGATLYVTLEPCSTKGRTPPCTEAILNAQFGRVVFGAVDPNPAHAGRALRILRRKGVKVQSGILGVECTSLNPGFNKWIVNRFPFVIAKAGLSLDGRLTRPPGESRWLTGPQARQDAHSLRASVDAILIGANTLRIDDPQLTVRGIRNAPQPLRVVLTQSGDLPPGARLFTDEHAERTLVYRREKEATRIHIFRGAGRNPESSFFWRKRSFLEGVLNNLGKRGITSVMIEGGNRVLSEAFDAHLVDRVHFYLAPMVCGGPLFAIGGRGIGASDESPTLIDPDYRRMGDDLRLTAMVSWASAP
jgi:diaminohydroxyphosphoribosylaminopyrimidine deaminase/5-amino-6-(5-phosphoribosylamino)uracil reductase